MPSALDPSLAPDGQHVVTLGFRSQPYRLAESDWDAERERVADRLIDGARDDDPEPRPAR